MVSKGRMGASNVGGFDPRTFLCVPGARTTADRLPVVRPIPGSYPIRDSVSGWVAPAPSYDLGRGPVQFLGAFDTMPWLDDYDEEMKRNLGAVDMPGGVTLRWSLPRATDYTAVGPVCSVAPQFRRAGALVLYVAGVDVMPTDWQSSASYPGLPAAFDGFAYNAAAIESQWATGLSFIRPNDPSAPVTTPGGPGGSADGIRWLAEHVARPALDLLAYCGGPGAEADLGELAGGHRYVAAWLRLWWPCWDGVDPLVGADLDLPYTLQSGRALNAGHRQAWHVAIPVGGPAMTAEGDVLTEGSAYGVCSPISGLWRASVTSNGDAGDPAGALFTGLELRNGAALATDTAGTSYNDHGNAAALLGSTVRHGGAATLLAGYDELAPGPISGLVCLSVVP